MKIISWNVNGIRAALKKGFFADFIAAEQPDVLCLQETKALPEQVDLEVPGYTAHWHSAEKKGYSGVLILTRTEPLQVLRGLGDLRDDPEGRCITAEYDDLHVVGVYTPNAQRDLARLPFRMEWDLDFLQYVKQLQQTKPLAI
jgi:exodeoxyribonuclease III